MEAEERTRIIQSIHRRSHSKLQINESQTAAIGRDLPLAKGLPRVIEEFDSSNVSMPNRMRPHVEYLTLVRIFFLLF
jgi:hypothetical protein